ncbi:unnamed protein product [Effrenium voratum]|nr:unnamed protein product [Effrenium voratum]
MKLCKGLAVGLGGLLARCLCKPCMEPTGLRAARVRRARPETYVEPAQDGREGLYFGEGSPLARRVVQSNAPLSTWQNWYKAPWWLQQGDIMTLYAAFIREAVQVFRHRRLVPTPDGGIFALDVFNTDRGEPDFASGRPVVILVPGLGGTTDRSYLTNMAAALMDKGFIVVGLNLRGCGGVELKTARPASAYRGATDDLRVAVRYVREKLLNETKARCQVCFAGWSLGGNMIVNALAEQKTQTGNAHAGELSFIDGGVALCPTHCLVRCAKQAREYWPTRNLYDPFVTRNLLKVLEPAKGFYQSPVQSWNGTDIMVDSERLFSAKRLIDLDEALFSRMFGYGSVEEYYYDASSCRRLGDVQVPLLLITAADDPMTTSWAPFDTVRSNENVVLAYTKHGGHLGWQDESNAKRSDWVEDATTSFLAEVALAEAAG